jgi:hypothetical protein
VSEYADAAQAIDTVRRWSALHARGIVGDAQVLNGVFNTMMEAPVTAADECVSALTPALRPLLLKAVREAVLDGEYNHWVLYVRGWLDLGLDVEQQKQSFIQKRPHYQLVCERLLALLQGEDRT